MGPTTGALCNFQGASHFWFNDEGFAKNKKMTTWPQLLSPGEKVFPGPEQRAALETVLTVWAKRVVDSKEMNSEWTICKASGNMIKKVTCHFHS